MEDIPIHLGGKECWLVLSPEGERKMEEMARLHPEKTPEELLQEMTKEKKQSK